MKIDEIHEYNSQIEEIDNAIGHLKSKKLELINRRQQKMIEKLKANKVFDGIVWLMIFGHMDTFSLVSSPCPKVSEIAEALQITNNRMVRLWNNFVIHIDYDDVMIYSLDYCLNGNNDEYYEGEHFELADLIMEFGLTVDTKCLYEEETRLSQEHEEIKKHIAQYEQFAPKNLS